MIGVDKSTYNYTRTSIDSLKKYKNNKQKIFVKTTTTTMATIATITTIATIAIAKQQQ